MLLAVKKMCVKMNIVIASLLYAFLLVASAEGKY